MPTKKKPKREEEKLLSLDWVCKHCNKSGTVSGHPTEPASTVIQRAVRAHFSESPGCKRVPVTSEK